MKKIYRFIDLFAGIGGIRIGFESVFQQQAQFIFAAEIDKFARQTYFANFSEM
jgi:DNA (cytosine-5)-methyltransferase 1